MTQTMPSSRAEVLTVRRQGRYLPAALVRIAMGSSLGFLAYIVYSTTGYHIAGLFIGAIVFGVGLCLFWLGVMLVPVWVFRFDSARRTFAIRVGMTASRSVPLLSLKSSRFNAVVLAPLFSPLIGSGRTYGVWLGRGLFSLLVAAPADVIGDVRHTANAISSYLLLPLKEVR